MVSELRDVSKLFNWQQMSCKETWAYHKIQEGKAMSQKRKKDSFAYTK
jgi:hypothetical protein